MLPQLRDIEYFAAIVEHGQVQRAAAALGLSQPALSKSLRRLEQAMKTRLLKRTPHGIELTSVGSALLARIRKLRLSLDDVTREVADLSEGRAGHLRIGAAGGSALHLVPMACATLLNDAPTVTLKLTVSDRNAMLTALRDGELDIVVAIGQGPRHDDLVEDHLYDDAFVVLASANHRLAKRRELKLVDLVRERWTLGAINGPPEQLLSQVLGNKGLPAPNIAVETTNLSARLQLVAATDLLALGTTPTVRYAAARFGIVVLRVKDFAAARRGGLFYRKDAYLSPVALRLIEILKTTAKEIAAERS